MQFYYLFISIFYVVSHVVLAQNTDEDGDSVSSIINSELIHGLQSSSDLDQVINLDPRYVGCEDYLRAMYKHFGETPCQAMTDMETNVKALQKEHINNKSISSDLILAKAACDHLTAINKCETDYFALDDSHECSATLNEYNLNTVTELSKKCEDVESKFSVLAQASPSTTQSHELLEVVASAEMALPESAAETVLPTLNYALYTSVVCTLLYFIQ